MSTYDVWFFCKECSEVHRVPVRLAIKDGPTERTAVGDLYRGKALPPELIMITNNYITCPTTKRMTMQKDNNQVFLVLAEP